MMHEIVTDTKSKQKLIAQRKLETQNVEKALKKLVERGDVEIDVDDLESTGCGGRWVCSGWPRRARRQRVRSVEAADAPAASASASTSGSKQQLAGSERIFGRKLAQQSAADRLTQAATAMEKRMEELGARANELRMKAMEASKSGKKAEALAALKRAKGVESQLGTCQQTHAALERQVDMLAESELQREIATALSASVTSVKKKSKGLLNRTEAAVDDSQEILDANDDLRQVLSGLQPSEAFDEDDLAEELAAMMAQDEPESAALPHEVGAAIAPASALADTPAYPSAPTRKIVREERSSLLADDSAAMLSAHA